MSGNYEFKVSQKFKAHEKSVIREFQSHQLSLIFFLIFLIVASIVVVVVLVVSDVYIGNESTGYCDVHRNVFPSLNVFSGPRK